MSKEKQWRLIAIVLAVMLATMTIYALLPRPVDKEYTEGTKVETQIASMYDFWSSQNVSFDIHYKFDNSKSEQAELILHFKVGTK